MTQSADPYPVQFSVDFPDRQLHRLSTFFRLLAIIPIGIVLSLVDGAGGIAAGGLLFGGPLLMILFRRKYPRWWFDWNLALLRFQNRVGAYLFLLSDEYPSTDEEQAVHLDIPYPDAQNDLNRWLTLVKWLLAIPHYFALVFLYILLFFVVIVAGLAILFTGRYPRELFAFVVATMRWTNRVVAYTFILTTDRYPPFRLGS
jgi:hypothetical protein